MRREIGYDVFASDDPHEQAMPFPNMGNNPLIPILGSCTNWHQSGFPSGARQGTPSPWIAQTCPQPLPCALPAGHRLLNLLLANWELAAFRSEEHTSELQSQMRILYAVICMKNKNTSKKHE